MNITDLTKLDEMTFRKIADDPKYKEIIPKKIRFLLNTRSYEDLSDVVKSCYLIDGEVKDSETESIERILCSQNSDWYEYRTKNRAFLLQKEKLGEIIKSHSADEPAILSIVLPADFCGHIWYAEDFHIFIELFKGGLQGIWDALGIPSYYVLDRYGKILAKQENIISKYYIFDNHSGDWDLHTSADNEAAVLNEKESETLCNILHKTNKDRIHMKLAWTCTAGKFHIEDIILPLGPGIIE